MYQKCFFSSAQIIIDIERRIFMLVSLFVMVMPCSVSLLGSAGSVETTDPSIVMNRKAELVAELRQLKADDNAT
jgi:hypothetical protein